MATDEQGSGNHGRAWTIRVLGVPVRFEADNARMRRRIESAFSPWSAFDGRWADPDPRSRPAIVRLAVSSDGRGGFDWPPAVRAGARGRLVVRANGIAGCANARRSRAWCRVAARVLADEAVFADLVSTLALWLVTHRDRRPVHGATVALGGRGLVLAAPSGTGKSTLAYAAHREGLRVLDDDVAYVQLEPRLRVWGRFDRLHLAPDAAAWFPELAGRPVVVRTNGKRRIRVALPGPGAADGPPAVEPVGICLLERGTGRAVCERVSPDAAAEWLLARSAPAFAVHGDAVARCARSLVERGAWRLRLSDDPTAAVSYLRELLEPRS